MCRQFAEEIDDLLEGLIRSSRKGLDAAHVQLNGRETGPAIAVRAAPDDSNGSRSGCVPNISDGDKGFFDRPVLGAFWEPVAGSNISEEILVRVLPLMNLRHGLPPWSAGH